MIQKLFSLFPLVGVSEGRAVSHDDAVAMLRRLGFAVRDPSSGGAEAALDLMRLSGAEFERLIAQLVSKMGFRAEITKASGDGGVDVVAVFDRPMLRGRYLIQCKRFGEDNLVGAPLVREFYGAVVADRAIKGIFITTSSFTAQARQFAETLPLELIDGEELRRLLTETGPGPTA